MATKNEGVRNADFILTEANLYRSREVVKVNTPQNLLAGTILGNLLGAGVATAVGTPTGNGVITVGAVGADAQPGVYTLVNVTAAANGGTFNLIAPDGTLVRTVGVGGGAAANDHVTVTIADGATDFAAGDTYTITVAAGDVEALDLAEDDGAQIPYGILYGSVDATDADAQGVALVRDCEVHGELLQWPSGTTAAQKLSIASRLEQRGIIVRWTSAAEDEA